MSLLSQFEANDVAENKTLATVQKPANIQRIEDAVHAYGKCWFLKSANMWSDIFQHLAQLKVRDLKIKKDDLQHIIDRVYHASENDIIRTATRDFWRKEGIESYYAGVGQFISPLIQKCYDQGENDFAVTFYELPSDGDFKCFGNILRGNTDNPITITTHGTPLHYSFCNSTHLNVKVSGDVGGQSCQMLGSSRIEVAGDVGKFFGKQCQSSTFTLNGVAQKGLGYYSESSTFHCNGPLHRNNHCRNFFSASLGNKIYVRDQTTLNVLHTAHRCRYFLVDENGGVHERVHTMKKGFLKRLRGK